MAEVIYTCQNLSNSHIVVYWGNRGVTQVAGELSNLGLNRFPPGLKDETLKGFIDGTDK